MRALADLYETITLVAEGSLGYGRRRGAIRGGPALAAGRPGFSADALDFARNVAPASSPAGTSIPSCRAGEREGW